MLTILYVESRDDVSGLRLISIRQSTVVEGYEFESGPNTFKMVRQLPGELGPMRHQPRLKRQSAAARAGHMAPGQAPPPKMPL